MIALLLHIFPAYKTIQWLRTDNDEKDVLVGMHWMTFWMVLYVINLFLSFHWPFIIVLYFPEVTLQIRTLIFPFVLTEDSGFVLAWKSFINDYVFLKEQKPMNRISTRWIESIPYISSLYK